MQKDSQNNAKGLDAKGLAMTQKDSQNNAKGLAMAQRIDAMDRRNGANNAVHGEIPYMCVQSQDSTVT